MELIQFLSMADGVNMENGPNVQLNADEEPRPEPEHALTQLPLMMALIVLEEIQRLRIVIHTIAQIQVKVRGGWAELVDRLIIKVN